MKKDRSVLLPPYMEGVPIWEDLVKIVDTVFEANVDDPTVWIAKLRHLWILTTSALDKVEQGQMLAVTDFELPEKEILVKQAKQLGFDFTQTDLINEQDYQRIVRNIALYWYEKGKPNFIDFLGFVVQGVIKVNNLWSTTTDQSSWNTYGSFLPEGDLGIGTPVWVGGEWFPTTHVQVVFDPFKFEAPALQKLINLFYTIANYNLVLESVVMEGDLWLHSIDEPELARIVVTVPLVVHELFIDTL